MFIYLFLPGKKFVAKSYDQLLRYHIIPLFHTLTWSDRVLIWSTMQGLVSAEHRLQLCHLACKSSEFIMVDPWEVTVQVLLEFWFMFLLINTMSLSFYSGCVLIYGSFKPFLQARQSTFQRSLTVLSRVKGFLSESGLIPCGKICKTIIPYLPLRN